MSITYGSFGDIITTIQLVHKALQALNASRGSAREFQDVVLELRTFHKALDHVRWGYAALIRECLLMFIYKVTAILADSCSGTTTEHSAGYPAASDSRMPKRHFGVSGEDTCEVWEGAYTGCWWGEKEGLESGGEDDTMACF